MKGYGCWTRTYVAHHLLFGDPSEGGSALFCGGSMPTKEAFQRYASWDVAVGRHCMDEKGEGIYQDENNEELVSWHDRV